MPVRLPSMCQGCPVVIPRRIWYTREEYNLGLRNRTLPMPHCLIFDAPHEQPEGTEPEYVGQWGSVQTGQPIPLVGIRARSAQSGQGLVSTKEGFRASTTASSSRGKKTNKSFAGNLVHLPWCRIRQRARLSPDAKAEFLLSKKESVSREKHCLLCGIQGHNRRTCPVMKPQIEDALPSPTLHHLRTHVRNEALIRLRQNRATARMAPATIDLKKEDPTSELMKRYFSDAAAARTTGVTPDWPAHSPASESSPACSTGVAPTSPAEPDERMEAEEEAPLLMPPSTHQWQLDETFDGDAVDDA